MIDDDEDDTKSKRTSFLTLTEISERLAKTYQTALPRELTQPMETFRQQARMAAQIAGPAFAEFKRMNETLKPLQSILTASQLPVTPKVTLPSLLGEMYSRHLTPFAAVAQAEVRVAPDVRRFPTLPENPAVALAKRVNELEAKNEQLEARVAELEGNEEDRRIAQAQDLSWRKPDDSDPS